MRDHFYLVLAGGVGAAKFIDGLSNVISQEEFKVLINTGDDIDLFGLKICPDIDIITYTLANVVDREKEWGYFNETFNCLSILKKYYQFKWFNLGDKDLATHIFRTDLLKKGFTKAEVTSLISKRLGIRAHLIPMCNEDVQTIVNIGSESIHFEEYYIKHNCEPEIKGIQFEGIHEATPVKNVLKYIREAKRIIISPSNPIVSIGTILQVKGIKETLRKVKNKVFAISPIIEGTTIKGPADKMMRYLGLEVSCVGVAKYYQDFLGHFVIDNRDCHLKSKIEELDIKTYCFDTIMENLDKKKKLAKFIIDINN
ncbi:MAG: 2-phospho-L-lactate transferase [Promethearchaeota archaeon]|jgi:LPPG:FO 2-phospho-L-lactate transferase